MKIILRTAILLISAVSFSQTVVSGKIVDEKNKPISGANVFIEGSYDGENSNEKGEFSFKTNAKSNQVLVASSLSYETKKIDIDIENYQFQVIILKKDATILDEVVITAGSLESGEKARVSVLKPLDIVTTAGNPGDIVSALQTLPGTQTVGESGKLFVRGGEANETQTFIDGIRVAQPYLQTANNLPTRSRFSPFLFKGTTFSTGGYSAEYGEALSSVLLLNTIDEPDQEKTDIGLMSVGLSLGNTQKWENNSFSFNANYINLAPYQALLPDNIDWNKPYNSFGGESVFRHNFKRGLLKVYVAFDAAQYDLNQDDINYPDQLHQENENNNFYTNTSYKGNFGTNWKIVTGFSYGYNQNKGVYDVNNYLSKENATHLKLKLYKPVSEKIKTLFGADYFLTKLDNNVNSFSSGYNQNIAAIYSETDFLFSKNVVSKVGFRFSKDFLLDEVSIDPRISLAYKITKNSQFSFAYGMFEQTPKKEYLIFTQNLQSEKTQHYILNFQYSKDRQTFRAEAYHKNYDNLVKYDTAIPLANSFYNNNGYGFANGLDIFWRDNKTIKNVEYWVSYSFIDTKRDYTNFPKEVTPSFVASQNLSLVTKYWIEDWRSQLGMTYSFTTGRPYNNPNETEFMAGKTKPYNNLSVNWAYLISPQKILFFSITNVAGFKNVYGYNYTNTPNPDGVFESQAITPAADRFFFVGFFWTISQDKKTNQLENL